jgi:hypothetical protein
MHCTHAAERACPTLELERALQSGGTGAALKHAAACNCMLHSRLQHACTEPGENKSDSKIKEGIAGKLSNRVKELVTNTAISLGGTQQQRQVLVMDEVDGMSGAPPPTPHVCMCAALWVCTCAALVVRSAGSARQLAHRRLYTALWLCSASER